MPIFKKSFSLLISLQDSNLQDPYNTVLTRKLKLYRLDMYFVTDIHFKIIESNGVIKVVLVQTSCTVKWCSNRNSKLIIDTWVLDMKYKIQMSLVIIDVVW